MTGLIYFVVIRMHSSYMTIRTTRPSSGFDDLHSAEQLITGKGTAKH
jgi:hypothetical protein